MPHLRENVQSFSRLQSYLIMLNLHYHFAGQNEEELLRRPVRVKFFGTAWRHVFLNDTEGRVFDEMPPVAIRAP